MNSVDDSKSVLEYGELKHTRRDTPECILLALNNTFSPEDEEEQLASQLIGVLSPVNHEGLYQG